MMSYLVLFCVINLLSVCGRRMQPRRPAREVVTTQGVVRGYREKDPPRYEFLGVPYATCAADSRFQSPEAPESWDGQYDATYRLRCLQSEGGVENCLVLNIFTPDGASGNSVLVYFHGGAYQSGWGPLTAPTRLIRQGLVVVTFNYRLGPFGFLCLGVPEAPGNVGLKDQVAALYWIQMNIENFGGNPADVTLYGTEAGAASVEHLLLSGLAKGLFHKAILESGTALVPGDMAYNPLESAYEAVVNLEGDPNATDTAKANFLKETSIEALQKLKLPFLPCIERDTDMTNSLINEDPLKALKEGHFDHIPMLLVYTNLEAVNIVDQDPNSWSNVSIEIVSELLPDNLDFENELMKEKISDLVQEFYFEDEENIIKNFVDYFSDISVIYPMVKSASYHVSSDANPVYLMEFSYDGDHSTPKESGLIGASVGDVKNYIFSKEGLHGDDEIAADRLVTLWINFIKHGDPTPLTSTSVQVIWQPIQPSPSKDETDLSSLNCLHLNTMLMMKTPSPGARLSFWDRVYDNFYKAYTDVFENKEFFDE